MKEKTYGGLGRSHVLLFDFVFWVLLTLGTRVLPRRTRLGSAPDGKACVLSAPLQPVAINDAINGDQPHRHSLSRDTGNGLVATPGKPVIISHHPSVRFTSPLRFSHNCWNIRQQVTVYRQTVDSFPFYTFERPDVALAGKLILGSFVGEQSQSFTCKSITVHSPRLYFDCNHGFSTT